MACSTSHIRPTMSQIITNYLVITFIHSDNFNFYNYIVSTQLRHHCSVIYLNSRPTTKNGDCSKSRVPKNAMHRKNSLINFESQDFNQNSFMSRREKLSN